jgi:hypothetical protein
LLDKGPPEASQFAREKQHQYQGDTAMLLRIEWIDLRDRFASGRERLSEIRNVVTRAHIVKASRQKDHSDDDSEGQHNIPDAMKREIRVEKETSWACEGV